MDSLFDQLNHIPSKRKTTYNKVAEESIDDDTGSDTLNSESKDIPDFGPSILFGNSIIGEIRDRLKKADGDEDDELDTKNSKDNDNDVTQVFPQTQKIENLYDGGEELEEENFKRSLNKTQMVSETVVTQITGENTQTQCQKTQIITSNETSADLTKTQPIALTHHIQTLSTQLRTQVVASPHTTQPTQVYESTQVMEIEYDTQNLPLTVDDFDQTNPELKIQEIERELDERTRKEKQKEIGTEYKVREAKSKAAKIFTKDDFLNHFDDSSSSEDETQSNKEETVANASENNTSDNNTKSLTQSKSINGLGTYEHNLRQKANNKQIIEFSESENDDDNISHISPSFASKAVILNIRAKKSKLKPKIKVKNDHTNLDTLYKNLKKASREQILNHQKELMEKNGFKLEDIEKENELVENLLEQEISRNLRIRQREKKKEQRKNESDSEFNSEAFDLSANEMEESDIPASENSDEETNFNEDSVSDTNEVDADDEEDEGFTLIKRKRYKTELTDDSDSDSISTKSKEIVTTNTIDLGHYGDNISQQNKEVQQLDEEDEKLEEEQYKAIIDENKRKQREREKNEDRKRKEMKASGVANMFEVEAEESEDEWHGVGGADGELSDAYDSELEKMIDDYGRQNFNHDEIREMLVKENKETDLAMVNKILYDIKNGGFRTRKRHDLDLEFSEDEDDYLKAYRAKKRALMREKRLDIDGDQKIVKNPKSKAFFESIVDDIVETRNPFDNHDDLPQDIITNETHEEEEENDKNDVSAIPKKKKIVISEDFVQRSLSFLNSSKNQNEFDISDETSIKGSSTTVTDLYTLKRHSSIKTLQSISNSRSSSVSSNLNENQTQDEGAIFADLRKTSVINSFGATVDINAKFKDGTKSVKVSTGYKTVGSARASITYMGTSRKLVAPAKKTRLSTSTKANNRMTSNKLFDTQEGSFD